MNTPTRIFAALLLAATMVVPSVAQEKVKFAKQKLKVGTVVTIARTTTNDMNQSQEMGGQSQTMTQSSKSKEIHKVTVLAVGEKGVTKAKFEFKTFDVSSKLTVAGQDQEHEETSPLTGKTYILTIGESGLEATTGEKEKVSAEELEALKKELKSELAAGVLVDPYQKMDSVIGAREMAMGEVIKIDKETANKIFGAGDARQNIKSIQLTLKGKKKHFGVECAVFDVKLELNMEDAKKQGLDIKADITGEYLVGLENLWSYQANVAGPITGGGTISHQMGDIAISMDGKVSMSAMAAMSQAKKE